MTSTIINHKKYKVERVFNLVANYHFIDKNGISHLVDAEDVAEFWDKDHISVKDVIAYAKELAGSNDGVFWWKIKETN